MCSARASVGSHPDSGLLISAWACFQVPKSGEGDDRECYTKSAGRHLVADGGATNILWKGMTVERMNWVAGMRVWDAD